MSEPTSDPICDAAPEFALDILDSAERAAFAAHLLRCPACRKEVDAMAAVGTRLLELIPGTEPPLGFDRRVLARMRPAAGDSAVTGRAARAARAARATRRMVKRHPLVSGLAAAAAAVALVFGSLGLLADRPYHPNQTSLHAEFHQGARPIGAVSATPGWLDMTLHGVAGVRQVTCELVTKDGATVTLGTFDLVGGSGSWGAPERAGLAGLSGALLVAPDGHVIATATFT